jgi:hypothetical protein
MGIMGKFAGETLDFFDTYGKNDVFFQEMLDFAGKTCGALFSQCWSCCKRKHEETQ